MTLGLTWTHWFFHLNTHFHLNTRFPLQEERLKVKAEFPDYSITEVAKELGRRWAQIDPAIKQSYEQRYTESRRQYEQALAAYKPQKKKKDPNAPKQPLSAYFLFSQVMFILNWDQTAEDRQLKVCPFKL